jgi:hypothetical protein
MNLKISDLGLFLTLEILVEIFFDSDHLVALFNVVKNHFFSFFNEKQNVNLISQHKLIYFDRTLNSAPD